MIRIYDPRKFYPMLEDPRVLKGVELEFKEDILRMVDRFDCYMLFDADETGGFIFMPNGDGGWYAAHTIYPIGRGLKHVATKARKAIEWMFIHSDATTIYSYVNPKNEAAAALMALAGMVPWMEVRAPAHRNFCKIDLDTWVPTCSTARSRGESFHKDLDQVSSVGLHEDDEIHDAYVGVALLMLESGNTMKAVTTYNNWATAVGYVPASIVCAHPVLVRIDDILLETSSGLTGVLLCR